MTGSCAKFEVPPPISTNESNLIIEEIRANVHDPRVWGPLWWFSIFNGCCSADEVIGRADRLKYWKFIEGLPYMLPCNECKMHAKVFVEQNKPYRDIICASRCNLTKFFVGFYNAVSKRTGGRALTMKDVEARFLRKGPIQAFKIRYG